MESFSAHFDPEIERRLLRGKRKIILTGDVDSVMAKQAVEDITIMAENCHEPIYIIMNSPGGHVEYGLAIIEIIKQFQREGGRVVGIVYGHAMSMMSYILQACDKRIAGYYSWLMVHGFSGDIFQSDKQDLEAQTKLMAGLTTQAAEIYACRNTSTDTQYHEQTYWEKILDSKACQFYSAVESLYMGLIDSINGGDVCQDTT